LIEIDKFELCVSQRQSQGRVLCAAYSSAARLRRHS